MPTRKNKFKNSVMPPRGPVGHGNEDLALACEALRHDAASNEASLAVARALLAMDEAALQAALGAPGLDLKSPLCAGMHAMELWALGCQTLPSHSSPAAQAALLMIFESGADVRKIRDSAISPWTTEYFEALAGLPCARALANGPNTVFFNKLDHMAAIDAFAGLMKIWEHRFGLGREDWLGGARGFYGDRGCDFLERPSVSLALCMRRAFGASLEPEHWLFFASSTYNASWDADLLILALEEERPTMPLDAREMLASAALSNDLPALLAAVARLPGGIGDSLKGRNVEHYDSGDKIFKPEQDVALLWAMLGQRGGLDENPMVGSALFLALEGISRHLDRACAEPCPKVLSRLKALDLIEAKKRSAWIFKGAEACSTHWGELLSKRDLPEIVGKLCRLDPGLALEVLAGTGGSLVAAMARREKLVAWAEDKKRWPFWEPSHREEAGQELMAAFAELERWGLDLEAVGPVKLDECASGRL